MLKGIANTEQARSWDGDDGDHWTEYDETYNRAVARHHVHLMRAAAIQSRDRVLDVGCGTGWSTCDAARAAPDGSATGIDLSSRMLERARQHARDQGLSNVRFEQADAQVTEFESGAYDLAISRFGAMFFSDPVAAFRNIAGGLVPGGRLVLMTWLPFEDNFWIKNIRDAFAAGRPLPPEPSGRPGPFGLAEPDHIRAVLDAAGFHDVKLQEVREPMWFGATVDEAFAFWMSTGLNRGLLSDADDDTRARAVNGLRKLFVSHQTAEGVLLDSAAWLTTARKR